MVPPLNRPLVWPLQMLKQSLKLQALCLGHLQRLKTPSDHDYLHTAMPKTAYFIASVTIMSMFFINVSVDDN